jgi:hypothetical protein
MGHLITEALIMHLCADANLICAWMVAFLNLRACQEVAPNGLRSVATSLAAVAGSANACYNARNLAPETPQMRKAAVKRTTKETDIEVAINLMAAEWPRFRRGSVPDHMLDSLARHSRIDNRHGHRRPVYRPPPTTEDVGIALGQAVKQALAK